MTYDDYKLMSDRDEDASDECTHWCENNHVILVHEKFDDEGRIPHACEYADEAQPLCETCAEWVWLLVDGVSMVAKMATKDAVMK